MRPTLLTTACAALTLLAGCNYDKSNDGVRAGPQAVHPSPSTLAQGARIVPTTAPEATVAAPAAHYNPHPLDGSQPIVD